MPTESVNELTTQLERLLAGIQQFLEAKILSKEFSAHRTFYGAEFARLFFLMRGTTHPEIFAELDQIAAENKQDSSAYHWEFVNYACLTEAEYTHDNTLAQALFPLTFRGTPVTNWSLLRSACLCKQGKLLAKEDLVQEGLRLAQNILARWQDSSGLIVDQAGVRSLQYHAFSTLLLQEIQHITLDPTLATRARKAIDYTCRHILSNGECLYLGRGQNQAFGFASIIALLSRDMHTRGHTKTLAAVLNHIHKFVRKDLSIPLAFSGLEESTGPQVDLQNENFAGWYAYNNYFDYLPFFAYFVQAAKEPLKSVAGEINESAQSKFWSDGSTRIYRSKSYEAVLARPQGAAANSMAIPFIVYRGKTISPCFGGEAFVPSLFHPRNLPLPWLHLKKISLEKWSRSFWWNNRLIIFSPWGILCRSFVFSEQSIAMQSTVFSPFQVTDQFCFPLNAQALTPNELLVGEVKITMSPPLQRSHQGYSATGAYSIWTSPRRSTSLLWSLPA